MSELHHEDVSEEAHKRHAKCLQDVYDMYKLASLMYYKLSQLLKWWKQGGENEESCF